MLHLALFTTLVESVSIDPFPAVSNRVLKTRKVACGMVSQYNITDPDKRYGVKNLGSVVGKRLTMRGFIVGDPEYDLFRALRCSHG